MYNVYINHFKRNGVTVDTEELMFAVPLVNNAYVQKPMVKSSEDSADSFSFTMDSNSPYYDAIQPYKTEIRVEYDGDIIFWGRAHEPTMSSVLHTKSVQCDGTYAYFNDSYYEGVQEKHRKNISISNYFTKVINNHNDMVPDKKIFEGEIGITLPTKEEKYEPTSWTQTMSILNELKGNNGGHFRIRYTNEDPYLDWYKYYIRDLGDGNRPKVKIGKNILDISTSVDKDNRFTRVIPIGSTNKDGKSIYIDGYVYKDKDNVEHTYSGKAMPVSFIRNMYTNAQLTDEFHDWTDYRDSESDYGIIYRPMNFGDADTQKKLFDEVVKWIKESYFPIKSSFTVKAIDMHILDNSETKILLGDCVDIIYLIVQNGTPTWNTKKLVCKAVQYDLYNPENNSYTFGFPSDLLDAATRKKSSKNTVSADSGSKKPPTKDSEDNDITWRKVWQMIGTLQGDPDFEGTAAAESFYNNGELKGTTRCYDPNDISDHLHPYTYLQYWFDAQNVGKITLQGKSVKYIAVSEDRGIFAYTVTQAEGPKVVYWYNKHKGYKYEGPAAGISTFEEIAKMIEKDATDGYGGTNAANDFRNNGRINGTVKCYDPNKTSSPSQHPEEVFQANIVGKFSSSIASTVYVASSVQYGIFAYVHAASVEPVTHWYYNASGNSYNNVSQLIHEEKEGTTYATDDGTPDGNKTVSFSPTALSYPEYDVTKTYSIGAIVTHDGKIWKCKTPISTPEAWDASHWDKYGDASVGQASIGYNLTEGTGDKWEIELNVPIQYTDADGNTQIAGGFVRASDFSVREIPSFKTKIGIFDIVIAGKVEAETISADLAEVRKWLGDNISVNTWIRTDKLYANKIYSYEDIYLNSNGRHHYQYQLSNSTMRNVDDCLYDVSISENNGTITITLPRLNGSAAASASFNMAATQFYKDAIDSARAAVSIGAIIYTPQSGDLADRSLNPGQWVKAQGTYVDGGGQTVTTSSYKLIKANTDANLVEENIKKDVSIFGVTGTYEPTFNLQVRGPIAPTTSDQDITPTSGYDGLSKVIISGDSDLVAGNIKKDVSIFGVTGTYEPYLRTPQTAIIPTTSNQTITPGSDSGGVPYDGLAEVTVSGDPDLVAGNIKKDVSIFGVTGTYEPTFNLQVRGPIAPTTSDQDITPTSGYDGLSKVIISGDSDLVAGNIKNGVTIFGVTGNYTGGGTGGITASDIDIANRGEIRTQADDPGSSYIELSALSQAIKNIPSTHHYIIFKGQIKNHSELGTKWYKIPW